jgi:hypothetical protein
MKTNQQKPTYDSDLDIPLSTILSLDTLQKEVSSMAKHSVDEGREHLNDLEIEHLIKMTNDVVMKIKQQTKEMGF